MTLRDHEFAYATFWWHKAVSMPQYERSIVFVRRRQYAPHLVHRNRHSRRTGAAPAESLWVCRPPDMSGHVMGRPLFALKINPSCVGICSPSILSPSESTTRKVSWSVQLLLEGLRSSLTDQLTDRPRHYVCTVARGLIQLWTARLLPSTPIIQGRTDGGISVYIPPKSVPENYFVH